MSTGDDISSRPEVFRRKLALSMLLPLIFIAILWMLRFLESGTDLDLSFLGIYPRAMKGLTGIITSPFIHDDISHLFNNSIPLFVLGTALFFFYPEVAGRVSIIIWVLTGIFVWVSGRSSWHIGASGIVYGLASFIFFSGIIRKHFRLTALSLLVVFLYGSMVWGMFPYFELHISWESHMLGAVSGLILAFWFKDTGLQNTYPDWYYEEDDNEFSGEQEESSGN